VETEAYSKKEWSIKYNSNRNFRLELKSEACFAQLAKPRHEKANTKIGTNYLIRTEQQEKIKMNASVVWPQ
jgi:hypothetical protein